MQLATAEFKREINSSHAAKTVVDSFTAGNRDLYNDVHFVSGNLIYDYDDASRSSMDIEVVDPNELTYEALEDMLNPFFTKLRARRGVTYPTGTEELLQLGIYYPTDVSADGVNNGAITRKIKAFDLSCRCQDDLETPFFVEAGQSLDSLIPALLGQKVSGMEFNIGKLPWTAPTLMFNQDIDPWAEARKLAAAAGVDLYIDRNDVCTIARRVLDPSEDADAVYVEGQNATFWGTSRSLKNEDYPNIVIIIGTNPGVAGISGKAQDDDPKSRTWVGRFKRVKTIRTELVTTTDQANAMARYMLNRYLGPQDEVSFEALPNPMLDVGDTVQITYPKMGLYESRRIISRIEMPLTVDAGMKVVTRRAILSDSEGTPVRL